MTLKRGLLEIQHQFYCKNRIDKEFPTTEKTSKIEPSNNFYPPTCVTYVKSVLVLGTAKEFIQVC